MALQFGTTLRNNRVSQIQTTIGASGVTLVLYNGTAPTNPGTALSGNTVLCSIALPASFLTSSGGVTTLAGSWTGTGAAGAGAGTAATFFRILDTGAVCHVQGNVTTDLVLNNANIATGQTVTVTTFAVTDANA